MNDFSWKTNSFLILFTWLKDATLKTPQVSFKYISIFKAFKNKQSNKQQQQKHKRNQQNWWWRVALIVTTFEI